MIIVTWSKKLNINENVIVNIVDLSILYARIVNFTFKIYL
ncbi:hypothetical protein CLU99_3784 [Flavobacterium sp. 2]|nr:hypothetical protein CLU99_3784 [Flavobacterium sp. 2]